MKNKEILLLFCFANVIYVRNCFIFDKCNSGNNFRFFKPKNNKTTNVKLKNSFLKEKMQSKHRNKQTTTTTKISRKKFFRKEKWPHHIDRCKQNKKKIEKNNFQNKEKFFRNTQTTTGKNRWQKNLALKKKKYIFSY